MLETSDLWFQSSVKIGYPVGSLCFLFRRITWFSLLFGPYCSEIFAIDSNGSKIFICDGIRHRRTTAFLPSWTYQLNYMVEALGLPVRQKINETEKPQVRESRPLHKSISSPKKWDVFISHASEDKNELARPLAEALRKHGISVWYDEFSLKMGDSLRASIDYGLTNSRYGVVILSKVFFAKHWPIQELNGLASREVNAKNVILPIWHKVGFDEVREFSPTLADRLAAKSEQGLEKLVEQIADALDKD